MQSTGNTNLLRRVRDALITWHTSVDSPQPEIAQGLRAAVGIFLPIAIGSAQDHVSWGVLVSLNTFWILLCDNGGAYRHKAAATLLSSLAMIAAFVVGVWASQSSITHIVGIFLWLSIAALFGVAGNAAAQAGLMSSLMFIVSSTLSVPGEFLIRTELCAVGALWAILLSLALWPLHASSPVFNSLATSYLKLADLLETFWSGSVAGDRPVANINFALAFDSFITQLENTRTIWGAVRARRAGPSPRSLQLLRLIEALDVIGGSVVALRQLVIRLGQNAHAAEVIKELHPLTTDLVTIIRNLARAIPKRGRNLDSAQVGVTLKEAEERLQTLFAPGISRDEQHFSNPEIESSALNLLRQIRKVRKLVANLESTHDKKEAVAGLSTEPQPKPLRFWRTVRDNFSFESDGFRHALRLGFTAAFGQAIATFLHLPRGYWITVTILFILKPNFGGTLQRAALRLTGTVLGGLIAAALSLMVQEQVVLMAFLPVLAFAAFSVRPINYGLYTLALTPMIMVMLDVGSSANWETSCLRVAHTFVGGILAVIGGYLLFPVWEKHRLPGELAGVLKANADFLRAIVTKSPEKDEGERVRRQRKAALALANAATVGQRVLSEPIHLGSEVESSLAAINDAREIFLTLSAITESAVRNGNLPDNLRELGIYLADFLDKLAAGIGPDGAAPQSPDVKSWEERLHRVKFQDIADPNKSPDLARQESLITQFEGLIEAIQALHSAVSRLGTEDSSPTNLDPVISVA
jgi:uncharacterized membrane protein YccC